MKEIKFNNLSDIRQHLLKGETVFDNVNHYAHYGWGCSEGCCQWEYDPKYDGSREDFIEYLCEMIKDRNEHNNYKNVYDYE